jgi:hypothetical protein
MTAGEVDENVTERECGLLNSLAGYDRPGAGKGAGVVGRLVGVAVDDGNVARARGEHGRGELTV